MDDPAGHKAATCELTNLIAASFVQIWGTIKNVTTSKCCRGGIFCEGVTTLSGETSNPNAQGVKNVRFLRRRRGLF